jgi:anti-anti-sigma factor
MSLQPRRGGLVIEQVGKVNLVKFTPHRVLTEETVEILGRQLLGLVEDRDCHHLVLNFSNVERLSSALVGRLMGLHRRLRREGRRLAVCGIKPDLYAVFQILQLHEHLSVYGSENDALQALL